RSVLIGIVSPARRRLSATVPRFEHPALPTNPRRIDWRLPVESRRLSAKHVVFLRGGHKQREPVSCNGHLTRWPGDALVFNSDEVWARITTSTQLNRLAMEAQLLSINSWRYSSFTFRDRAVAVMFARRRYPENANRHNFGVAFRSPLAYSALPNRQLWP